ncbi:MAG: heparan-alpha-glucosaminide N-acetyltransferase domain-containing protein [Ruthenibacterium sp.]
MKIRYELLDTIRGTVLVSMVLYHAAWDVVYLLHAPWAWYRGNAAFVWQQSICWTFIVLSGFCWSLGKRQLRRGLLVFGAGAVITAATLLVMPENRVVFGVLTLLGSCMMLMIPLEKLLRKVPAAVGLCGCAVLFVLTRNINAGYLGFGTWNLIRLPAWLYHGLFAAYLGFTQSSFISTDYFSLLPWLPLFVLGYFAFRICRDKGILNPWCMHGIAPLSFLGKHTLLIYMLHQPVLYLLLSCVSGKFL